MTARPSATREVLGGSARVFVAEAISLPAGLVTGAVLARTFGTDGYGVFTLTMAIVGWLEWTIASLFARAAVKLVADAEDWRSAGAIVLRVYSMSGLLGFAALWLAAGPLASLMHEPSLARHLRVLAFDVPLFMLTQAHQHVLVGTGAYARRAVVAACRWTSRMIFVLVLVAVGLSIDGALAATVAASVLELIVARRCVQPSLRGGTADETRTLWTYALPLFAGAVSLRLFDKLDLFTLKALGASASMAGLYGAAQNLTVIPNLVALSVTTLLLSTLTRSLRLGDRDGARALATNAVRGVLALFPFAGIAASVGTAVSTMIYGGAFADSGSLLAVLIFGAVATVVILVASAILTAGGRPTLAMVVVLPMAPLALVGHLLVIPRYGARGATLVTTAVGVVGAVLALGAVHRAWSVRPPLGTVLRCAVVTAIVTFAGARWHTAGAMALVEAAVLSIGAVAMLVALGELTLAERQVAVAAIRPQ